MVHDTNECARELLDVVPSVMRFIRTEMRRHRALGLSVPQFRTLVYIERTGGTSLVGVAEHLGLTPPSACKIVDGLQGRQLITRTQSPEDRRMVTLQITSGGKQALADARGETQKSLTSVLSALSQHELLAVTRSMEILRTAFTGERVHANS
ncbi:MAG TPA: MarR family transcriptional regulator [Spirochaetia bacterium]|nr:MarR family transcriptional regulator [Spirochaetia bacterium]